MNKDELKGKVQNLKGRAKEAAGAVTGNKRTEAEGAAERLKGAAREKVGEVKRKFDNKVSEIRRRDDEDTVREDQRRH